jgi:hypothetical protein
MLEKINNISAGSEYGKSTKVNSFNGTFAANYTKKVDSHDSVDISPAMQYLNHINWRLKELKHVVNEKILIVFVVSEIEFQTTISLTDFNNIKFLDYRIVKEKKGENWRSKIFVELTSSIGKIWYDMEPKIINLSGLNVFLQRIFDANIYREISGDEKYLIDDLIADILPGIKNEFDFINNYLFNFVDKLTSLKLNDNRNISFNNNEPIAINKIKVLNA